MGTEGVEHGRERSQIRGRGGRIRENEWGPSPLLSGKWRVPMPGTVQWQGGWVIPLDWISIAPQKWDCQAIFGPLEAWEQAGPALCRRAVLRAVQAIVGTIDRPLTPDPIRHVSERKCESCSPFLLTYIGHPFVYMFPIIQPLDLELHHPIAQSRQFAFSPHAEFHVEFPWQDVPRL